MCSYICLSCGSLSVGWLVKVNIIIIVSVLYCRLYLYEYDTGTNGSGMAGGCKLDEGA